MLTCYEFIELFQNDLFVLTHFIDPYYFLYFISIWHMVLGLF
jgi:hypothetical protein